MAQNLPSVPNALENYSNKGNFIVNHFKFIALHGGNDSIHKYSVTIDPEIPESNCVLKRKVIDIARPNIQIQLNSYLIYYNSIFSRTNTLNSLLLQVTCDEILYNLKINHVAELHPFDNEHIHFMKVLLNSLLKNLKFQRIGQKYFNPKKANSVENWPLKIWPGFSASLYGTNTSSILKIDLCSKVANTSTVLSFIQELKMKGVPSNDSINQLLKGRVIYTIYNNKTYKVEGVNFSRTPKDEFKQKNNTITFLAYYEKYYSYKIKDQNQPLLFSKAKTGETLEFIPELCCLTGLDEEMRKDFHLMKSLSIFLNKKPVERLEECRKLINQIKDNEACQALLNTWNTNISDEAIKAEGHIIKAGSYLMKIPILIEKSQGLERDMQQEPNSIVKL